MNLMVFQLAIPILTSPCLGWTGKSTSHRIFDVHPSRYSSRSTFLNVSELQVTVAYYTTGLMVSKAEKY